MILGGDDCDISSPIHRSEAKFYEVDSSVDSNDLNTKSVLPKSSRSGLRKLAHLAEAINQWEDEINPVSIAYLIVFFLY